jgi:hypothetical protein
MGRRVRGSTLERWRKEGEMESERISPALVTRSDICMVRKYVDPVTCEAT